ncbi:MAG: hypothetical protein WCJ84_01610 [Candidatus Peregrinibacteria bacterium]
MDSLQISLPAKINRTLYITGYDEKAKLHTLDSEFCAISLSDFLHITKIADRKIKISVSGPFAKGVPNNEHNSMYKMAKAFFAAHGFSFGIEIHLVKNIPHQAGLGGGSSDAAGVLRALEYFASSGKDQGIKNEDIIPLFSLPPNERKTPLSAICAVGNDIPFFLGNTPQARVQGFGEIISPSTLPTPASYGILIFNPRITVATAWAYHQFATTKESHSAQKYQNDFEPVIFSHFPDLGEWKNALVEHGAKEAGLTGSGSGIFGLFETEKELKNALKLFPDGIVFYPL